LYWNSPTPCSTFTSAGLPGPWQVAQVSPAAAALVPSAFFVALNDPPFC